MSNTNPTTTDNPFSPEALADFREWLRSQTPEELAKRLTTYQPDVPHFWYGQPVEPITKEELLSTLEGAKNSEIDNEADAVLTREKSRIQQ